MKLERISEDLCSFKEAQEQLKLITNALGEMENENIKDSESWTLCLEIRLRGLKVITGLMEQYLSVVKNS